MKLISTILSVVLNSIVAYAQFWTDSDALRLKHGSIKRLCNKNILFSSKTI